MPLILRVLSYKGRRPEKLLSTSFDQQGGTLGRYSRNNLVLYDPEKIVSGRHAEIKYENGLYYLVDDSTNGTCIYNRDIVLRHESTLIKNGDRLKIGDYELIVNIDTAGSSSSNEIIDNEKSRILTPPDPESQSELIDKSPNTKENVATEDQPLKIGPLTWDDFDNADKENETTSLNVKSSTPEDTIEVPELNQKDYKEPYGELLGIFLEAAKIADTSFFEKEDVSELIRNVGRVLRELVEGLMTLLRSRTGTKKEYGVPVTVVQPKENNPLKFASNVEDALKFMLIKKYSGFIDAVDAVHESYEDIKDHNFAQHAGFIASLENVIKRFDPVEFAQQHSEGFILKNAKLWEAYCQAYDRIAKEAKENIFGDEFSRAYESTIQKLCDIHKNRSDDAGELANV